MSQNSVSNGAPSSFIKAASLLSSSLESPSLTSSYGRGGKQSAPFSKLVGSRTTRVAMVAAASRGWSMWGAKKSPVLYRFSLYLRRVTAATAGKRWSVRARTQRAMAGTAMGSISGASSPPPCIHWNSSSVNSVAARTSASTRVSCLARSPNAASTPFGCISSRNAAVSPNSTLLSATLIRIPSCSPGSPFSVCIAKHAARWYSSFITAAAINALYMRLS